MNTYTPMVSIVIPVYNGGNYLKEAIDSALAQTYKNIEIIVVNDGSTDNGETEKIAKTYGDKIRYFYKENGGSSSALNYGIKKMTGEWFSWLSHDDLYYPQKIERQISYLNELDRNFVSIDNCVLFAASELINEEGKKIRKTNMKKELEKAQFVNNCPHNGYLVAEPTVYSFHGCSCLVHRNTFSKIGVFDEKLKLLNDFDYWFRVYTNNYKVYYIPEILVQGRIHSKQVSRSIGFSYHNPEQDMFWNRSLDWLIENYPNENLLLYRYGKNAYLKTRNLEGDRAFDNIKSSSFKIKITRSLFIHLALIRSVMKKLYLSFRV